MNAKLRKVLRKLPLIHNFATILYQKIRYIKDCILGTKAQEKYWETRHIREGNKWIEDYWNNRDHPHRFFLTEKIETLYPFSSIMEIGCSSGPNLYLLSKKFPNAEIRGVDINPKVVQRGNEWFVKEGISNVKLFVGKADELSRFRDKSFDIVLTDALLIYIGPDKIRKVIAEIIRIAKKAMVLVEWHCEREDEDNFGLGLYHCGYYKRDYVNLLKGFVNRDRIHVTKIPEEMWPGEDWGKMGYIIEVIL